MDEQAKDWTVGNAAGKYYAAKWEGSFSADEIYDPENLVRMTARFSRNRFTKQEAIRLVDKMNRKGSPVEVDGQGRSK
jgi:hypothetical protein